MKSYWEEYKKKHTPQFSDWIKKGVDDQALGWIKDFANYLTNNADEGKYNQLKNRYYEKNNLNKKEAERELKKFIDDHKLHYYWEKGPKERNTLSTSKLRKFFGAVKKIQNQLTHKEPKENYRQFQLLIPKLAYDVGREKDPHHKLVDFYYAVEELAEAIKNAVKEDGENGYENFKKVYFPHFVDFFESLVAYFKAYENKVFENA